MAEVRFHGAEDARRERVVEAFKRHVRAARPDASYDADIEYLEHAIIAFADECGDLTAAERAELHALRDLRATVIGFGGDDFTIMGWVDAHRLHKDEPYIGCVFCRDRFVSIDAARSDPALNESAATARSYHDIVDPMIRAVAAQAERTTDTLRWLGYADQELARLRALLGLPLRPGYAIGRPQYDRDAEEAP